MATGTRLPAPFFTALDNDGVSISGALLYFYESGSTTPITVYTDVGLTVPHSQPVICDSAGRATVYLTPGTSVKLLITTPAGSTVRTEDTMAAVPAGTVDLDVSAVAGEALTAITVDAVYISDGSAGLIAGRWYKADADFTYASSTAGIVGMAPASIANGATGSVRVGGRVTGLSGLTTGAAYYVSTTAGAITATAPATARFVGTADTTTSLLLGEAPFQSAPTFTTPTVQTSINLVGGQITFPATQIPSTGANVLDDYEETISTPWLPVIGGAGGTSGQAYAVQVGLAIKIGRLVHISGRVQLSTLGTVTGNVQLQGLPYAAAATTNYRFPGMVGGEFNSFTTAYVHLTMEGVASASAMTLYGLTAASSGNAVLAQANLSANTSFTFSATYVAAA